MWWRSLKTRLARRLAPLLLLVLLALVVAPDWPVFQSESHTLNRLVALREFDFLSWWLRAMIAKGEALAAQGHDYLDSAARKQLVLDYLHLVEESRGLQREIEAVYADPAVAAPEVAAAALQARWEETRAALVPLQPAAEAIVQSQVAAILVEEGFGVLGEAWPPVAMHMTPLPLVLIVSPREEIRQIYSVPLEHGLPIPEREALEEALFAEMDRSALVVPIGGLGLYPSMIVETGNINLLADVVAHEWAHHWLTLHPLGIRYNSSPELRTINETVASIVGAEIGALVVARFYPELVPPPPAPPPPPSPAEATPFDFRAEMAATRARLDELLAAGEVEAAEAYLETRRVFFVENGYQLRKLNQAYFAFYGAYADTPGASGQDPVGPTVVTLREQSSSLYDFLRRVAPVTSFAALQEEVAREN